MKYLDSFPFGLVPESTLVLLVFNHNLLESVPLLDLSILGLGFFEDQFLLDFLDQKLIEFIIFLFLVFLPLVLILDLSISHLFLEINLVLVLSIFILFSLIIETALLNLKFVVFSLL